MTLYMVPKHSQMCSLNRMIPEHRVIPDYRDKSNPWELQGMAQNWKRKEKAVGRGGILLMHRVSWFMIISERGRFQKYTKPIQVYYFIQWHYESKWIYDEKLDICFSLDEEQVLTGQWVFREDSNVLGLIKGLDCDVGL